MKISNYNKPSHPKLKLIADIAIYSSLVYSPIIMGLPINDTIKAWIISGLSFVSVTFKFITKFTIDPNYVDNINIISSTSVEGSQETSTSI